MQRRERCEGLLVCRQTECWRVWVGRSDDPADPWVLQWFLVAPDGTVRRVGGFEELLDAGDYDNDGRSEVIFFSTRSEHSDTYDLLYGDDLQKRATLVIGYR